MANPREPKKIWVADLPEKNWREDIAAILHREQPLLQKTTLSILKISNTACWRCCILKTHCNQIIRFE